MCKKIKKIISVSLTFAMLFSVTYIPSFAKETETFTDLIETVEQTETEIEKTTVLPKTEEIVEEITDQDSTNAEENTKEKTVLETENTDATDELQTEETKEIQLMSSDVSLMSTISTIEGDGTVDNPYLIKTEADLLALANEEITNALSANYELQNDIVVTSKTWVPIGNSTEFSGHFDGNGYTISGIILEGSGYNYTGFFGRNSGLIENLTVDVTFSASNYLGGLVAYNTGTIRNCLTKGTVNGTSSNVGGLVGDNNDGTINTSGSTAVVTGSSNVGGLFGSNAGTIKNLTVNGDVSGQSNVGILAGYNSGTIENCLTKGTVNGTSSNVGGLVGDNNDGTINTSGSTAVVTGSSNVGGLVGQNRFSGKITNCYAQGNVTGSSNVGGLVGFNDYWSSSYTPVVQYCYSIGVVSGNNSGGLIGHNKGGSVTASYYNSETSGQTDTVKGTPVLTNDMKLSDTYAGWDFDKVWAISSSVYEGYPYLKTMIPIETVSVTGVTLNKSTLSLTEGNTETLTATVNPTDATNKGITWASLNTSVATVSNGKVTAKAAGTATITVTTVDGGYTANCNVTVTEKAPQTVAVTGVTLNKSAVSLEKGKTETLVATVAPSNATNKGITWASSNTNVATVSDGKVTAKSAGTAVITATTADGGYTANCTVTVTEKVIDENAPKITITDIKAKPGKEIQVTVDLKNNTGFASLGIEVGYNSDIMTLTNVTSNTGVGGTFTKAQYLTVNPFNMGWDSASNITYNGNLATLTFKIGDDVADGIYPITLDYYKGVNGNYVDGDNINYDENFVAVGFVYVSGNVIIASYIPGDINGDENVDNKDATYLLRYLAGWSIPDLAKDALDVDGSTTVDNKDATILLRYLAGWSVTLH